MHGFAGSRAIPILIYVALWIAFLGAPIAAAEDPGTLFAAVRAGDLEEVKRLVEAGAEIDAVDPDEEHRQLAWSIGRGGAYMPTPLLYRGLFYIVHHNGRLVAYDAATGDAVLKSRFSRGGVFTASPVAANGKLYMATEEGLLYVLEAGPQYREIVVHEFGEPLMATPAISEGILLVRTPSRLIALSQPRPIDE